MLYLFLLLSVVTSSAKAIVGKRVGTSAASVRAMWGANVWMFGMALLTLVVLCLVRGEGFVAVSPATYGLAVCYSLSVLGTQFAQMRAMTLGTAALTSFVYSCGFLPPVIVSAIAYDESIAPGQIAGIALMLLALYLLLSPKGDRPTASWFLFAFLAMGGSGLTAILQKIHQRSAFAGELPSFLMVSFALSATLSGIFYVLLRRQEPFRPDTRLAGVTLFGGVVVGLLNAINLHLAGRLPAVVQFPVYNVGGLMLTGLGGRLLFSERCTRLQWLGFLVGCAGIVIIGIYS